ncbi:MAG: NfeD family protein [Deltaproteobacteria bacterium]|nr:NfeD family protein [Deltaproteobacteria bacterium]
MVWWHWLVVGLALAGAEMLTPGGFYFVFFGLAGLLVGAALGVGIPMPTWVQILAFSVLSFGLMVLFRRRLQQFLTRQSPTATAKGDLPDIVGEIGTAVEDIASGDIGKVELRGTQWSARAEGAALAKGQRCRVVRVEGLTLWVRPE